MRRSLVVFLLVSATCWASNLIVWDSKQPVYTDKIRQFGITWTFDQPYRYGTFVNGDYWVVGPVNIIAIDPPSVDDGTGRIINGSMIDPDPNPINRDIVLSYHGYDSTGYPAGHDELSTMYQHGLNVAYGVSAGSPLHIEPVKSLVSTISVPEAHANPILKTAAVLTVVSEVPDPHSFRPPYASVPNKSVRYKFDPKMLDMLNTFAPPEGSVPSVSSLVAQTQRVWLDHVFDWPGRWTHPADNMPNYGSMIADTTAQAGLALNYNYEKSVKRPLLVNYLQIGIDLFGIIEAGSRRHWRAEAGHSNGRKLPIVFAAKLFDDADMKAALAKAGDYLYSNGYYPTNPPEDCVFFSEDCQIFYVTSREVEWSNSELFSPDPRDAEQIPYTNDDIGLPEWGIIHNWQPWHSNAWWGTIYRSVCGPQYVATGMAVLLFDARDLWNHQAFFDYMDRYQTHPDSYLIPYYTQVYETYRENYPPVWSEQ